MYRGTGNRLSMSIWPKDLAAIEESLDLKFMKADDFEAKRKVINGAPEELKTVIVKLEQATNDGNNKQKEDDEEKTEVQ